MLARQALSNLMHNKLPSLEVLKCSHQAHIWCGGQGWLSLTTQARLNIALVVRR